MWFILVVNRSSPSCSLTSKVPKCGRPENNKREFMSVCGWLTNLEDHKGHFFDHVRWSLKENRSFPARWLNQFPEAGHKGVVFNWKNVGSTSSTINNWEHVGLTLWHCFLTSKIHQTGDLLIWVCSIWVMGIKFMAMFMGSLFLSFGVQYPISRETDTNKKMQDLSTRIETQASRLCFECRYIYICLVYNMYILYHIIYIYQRCISIKSRISSCRTWFQSKDWIFQLHHFFLLHLGIFFVLIRISLSYCVNYISILLEGNLHCSLTEPISFTIANYKNILRWHMI